jgi:hypothetical protein
MKPVTAAYVAAMIDGEGVVTLGKARSSGSLREWTYRPRVIVTNSHEGVIEFLREVTGLGHTYRYAQPQRPEWSTMLRWQVTSNACRLLLTEVRDYLVIKRRQADLILAMPLLPKGGRGDVAAIDQAQRETFDAIAALNKRGRKDDPTLREFPSDHPAFGRE